ncbi:MAG: hypothetical protein JWQ66_2923 [Mucilaginibacter sp.]|nr:hypothetical protein [Mucilaginibacter sp.]
MNRKEAKELSTTVTPEQIREMLLNAQNGVKDWTKPSPLNKGLSLGYSINLFNKINWNEKTHWLVKRNALATFGDFLPGYTKAEKKNKAPIYVYHEEPNFQNHV